MRVSGYWRPALRHSDDKGWSISATTLGELLEFARRLAETIEARDLPAEPTAAAVAEPAAAEPAAAAQRARGKQQPLHLQQRRRGRRRRS